MLSTLIQRFGKTSEFVKAATALGVSRTIAKQIEPGATHVSPDEPERVLRTRELLERAALHVAVGDGNNLELSFQRVDALAACFETLQLVRTTDIPDPFRRVWVSIGHGNRIRGVALTCQNGEVAIFCPPDSKPISDEGHEVTLAYRSFKSTAEFQLQLNDSCLFVGGLMLHLSRPGGNGTIGRAQERFDIDLPGLLRPRNGEQEQSCVVLDVSMGGLRVECGRALAKESRLSVKLWLSDGEIDAFVADAEVRWVLPGNNDKMLHGLRFIELDARLEQRLTRFLLTLNAGGPSLLG